MKNGQTDTAKIKILVSFFQMAVRFITMDDEGKMFSKIESLIRHFSNLDILDSEIAVSTFSLTVM